jgi:hypothetical protein
VLRCDYCGTIGDEIRPSGCYQVCPLCPAGTAPALITRNQSDSQIRSVPDWLLLAPPQGGVAQWRDGRSAKEFAKAWFASGSPEMPQEVAQTLASHPLTRAFLPATGIAEVKTNLDSFGGPRKADLHLLGRASSGRVLIEFEAKADETFDRLISSCLGRLKARSNLGTRIQALTKAVLGLTLYPDGNDQPDPAVATLYYQLLYSVASVLIAAEKAAADLAVFLVLEFTSPTLKAERVSKNHADFTRFVKALPGLGSAEPATGTLLGPVTVPGGGRVPQGIPLLVGKVQRPLP